MWAFVYKYDTEEHLTKYKSRIVARGDLQRNGIQDTYAATLFAKTFRAMMAIAAYFGLEAHQWDIKNAFVNAAMDKKHYSLRRSPRLWQKTFITTLTELGLQGTEDSCVFFKRKYSSSSFRR
jgi:hypothetical protein